jgi:hypothetical protein
VRAGGGEEGVKDVYKFSELVVMLGYEERTDWLLAELNRLEGLGFIEDIDVTQPGPIDRRWRIPGLHSKEDWEQLISAGVAARTLKSGAVLRVTNKTQGNFMLGAGGPIIPAQQTMVLHPAAVIETNLQDAVSKGLLEVEWK